MKSKIYLLSHELKWQVFKKLWDSVPDEGPTPQHIDKIIWELLREKRIYIWFKKGDKDLSLGLELPKNVEVFLLTNSKAELARKEKGK